MASMACNLNHIFSTHRRCWGSQLLARVEEDSAEHKGQRRLLHLGLVNYIQAAQMKEEEAVKIVLQYLTNRDGCESNSRK